MTPRSAFLASPDGFIAGVLDAQWIEIVIRDLEKCTGKAPVSNCRSKSCA